MCIERALAPALGVLLALAGADAAAACALSGFVRTVLWSGHVGDAYRASLPADRQFGAGNLTLDATGLHAAYPQGSYDPAAVRSAGAPLGGAQFKTPWARLGLGPAREDIGLRFRVTPAPNFVFVRGGKLPGLYGGRANSGGRVPDGSDGFSLRFVWQAQGDGALSAYLPGSGRWGTLFGLGRWRFVPGQPLELALVVRMNTPGRADGVIAAWAGDDLVAHADDIDFRHVPGLALDGFFFSSFFGGSTPDWASPVDTRSHFGPMEIFRLDAAALTALARCAAALPGLQARRELN